MASFTLDGRPDTEALRQSFNAIVTDGSGTIDSPKLRALLKNRLGAETTETEADEMCANATITCDEFIDVCRRIRAGEVSSPSGRRYAKMMEEFDALFESLERPPLSTPTKPVDAAGDAPDVTTRTARTPALASAPPPQPPPTPPAAAASPAEQRLAEGKALRAGGQLDDAIAAFKAAAEADPEMGFAAWFEIGVSEAGKGTERGYDAAAEAYSKCIELDARNSTAYVCLGAVSNVRGDFDAAEKLYRTAIEVSGERDAMAYNNLGALLKHARKDFDGAEQALRRAIELEPTNFSAYANLASLLHFERKDFDGAEQMYRKALELDGNYVNAHLGLASLLLSVREDYDGAERACRKVLELDSENKNAKTLLQTTLSKKPQKKKGFFSR